MLITAGTFAYLAHFAFLLVYAVLVWALLWHYKKYSLPKDKARFVWGAFFFFSAVFALVATVLLFLVPWEEILKISNF